MTRQHTHKTRQDMRGQGLKKEDTTRQGKKTRQENKTKLAAVSDTVYCIPVSYRTHCYHSTTYYSIVACMHILPSFDIRDGEPVYFIVL